MTCFFFAILSGKMLNFPLQIWFQDARKVFFLTNVLIYCSRIEKVLIV